ncbi:MAG: hypothetical protein EOO85_28365, partial [Pedobacter sp.]
MKHLKIYIRLFMFSGLSLLNYLAYAQDEHEKRQKALKENTEQLNRVYENNLPNKKGSTYTALTPEEIEASWKGGKTMTEKERYNAAAGPLQTVYDEEKGDYVYVSSRRSASFGVADTKILEELMHSVAEKKHLYLSDKIEWYKDVFFATAMNVYKVYEIKPLDYDAASNAVLTFSQTNGNGSYQSLYDLVWKARILPLSARNMILF